MAATPIRGSTNARLPAPRLALEPLLSLEQVADILQTSEDWVRDHATRRKPRIPVVRLGGKRALLRFRPADIERFIQENLKEG